MQPTLELFDLVCDGKTSCNRKRKIHCLTFNGGIYPHSSGIFQMKPLSKQSRKGEIEGSGRASARKGRRSPKLATTRQLPASDSEFAQPHAERKEGYELNDRRARWDSGKQVGHKI
jgi:hypothetical protein